MSPLREHHREVGGVDAAIDVEVAGLEPVRTGESPRGEQRSEVAATHGSVAVHIADESDVDDVDGFEG